MKDWRIIHAGLDETTDRPVSRRQLARFFAGTMAESAQAVIVVPARLSPDEIQTQLDFLKFTIARAGSQDKPEHPLKVKR